MGKVSVKVICGAPDVVERKMEALLNTENVELEKISPFPQTMSSEVAVLVVTTEKEAAPAKPAEPAEPAITG